MLNTRVLESRKAALPEPVQSTPGKAFAAGAVRHALSEDDFGATSARAGIARACQEKHARDRDPHAYAQTIAERREQAAAILRSGDYRTGALVDTAIIA
jgi:hypothetical protein